MKCIVSGMAIPLTLARSCSTENTLPNCTLADNALIVTGATIIAGQKMPTWAKRTWLRRKNAINTNKKRNDMDYEKAYKNALEWAMGIYPKAAGAFKEDLEHYFPELAESEDEKIRKELIAFLKENHETGRADETWSLSGIECWISWLEKQGSTALSNSSNIGKDKQRSAEVVKIETDEEYINKKIEQATPKWEGVDVDEHLKEIRGENSIDGILTRLDRIYDLLLERLPIIPYIGTSPYPPRIIEPWYKSPLTDVQANTRKEGEE